MASKPACHTGDIVLLRAEIIGLGSEGPYVRVETGSGGAPCFWAPAAAVARIDRAVDAAKETTRGIRWNLTADKINLARGSWGDWQA
jgi:hypothetical protein